MSSPTRWYATRSGLNACTDEDRAMAHEQRGPFDSREEARLALVREFARGVLDALAAEAGSTARMFGEQYAGLLTSMALVPDAEFYGWEGVRWHIWSSTPIRFEEPECEPCVLLVHHNGWAAEGHPGPRTLALRAVPASVADGTVVFSASDLTSAMRTDLTPAMRTGLLEEHCRLNTALALRDRGLLLPGKEGIPRAVDGPRGGHYQVALSDAGRRAAEALRAELDAAPIVTLADSELPPVDESLVRAPVPGESWDGWSAFGYLAQAVKHHLTGQSSAEQLRADLASVARAVNAGRELSDISETDLAWMGGRQ